MTEPNQPTARIVWERFTAGDQRSSWARTVERFDESKREANAIVGQNLKSGEPTDLPIGTLVLEVRPHSAVRAVSMHGFEAARFYRVLPAGLVPIGVDFYWSGEHAEQPRLRTWLKAEMDRVKEPNVDTVNIELAALYQFIKTETPTLAGLIVGVARPDQAVTRDALTELQALLRRPTSTKKTQPSSKGAAA